MSKINLPRNNFFDGQNVTETDMDTEQTAWHDTNASGIEMLAGSGVEQEFAVQQLLFDSDDVPTSIYNMMSDGIFDGEPIYELDAFDLRVFSQPSAINDGCLLEVKMSNSDLVGSLSLKVYLFGLALGDKFIYEVLTFTKNESQITRQYFTKIIAIMTQDFKGNQNTLVTGTPCRDSGGLYDSDGVFHTSRLQILESVPMTVVRDPIMAQQVVEPNMDFVDFRPATMTKTLDTVLSEIAATYSLNYADLEIKTEAANTRTLPPDESGTIIGQKFQVSVNNLQKISTLLSVEANMLVLEEERFNWSGDIVVGIRKLQETTTCPTDTTPGTAIEFDPEPSSLAEVSFSQSELAARGVVLTDKPQIVDFVFTQSLLANPSTSGLEVGKYYIVTFRRSGDISNGTLVLQEALDVADDTRLSIFAQNKWTDIPESDLWFNVYTSAIRITNGTAIDHGVEITSPKSVVNGATGLDEPYIDGGHSLLDISSTTNNYVIVQQINNFTTSIPHPSTGNMVFSRIEDAPDVSVVSVDTLTTLIDAGNHTIVLGSARDTNPTNSGTIYGTTSLAGLIGVNTFTIIQPASDIWLNNLVGATLIPNADNLDNQYRIIKTEIFEDAYGDVNGDGIIDVYDVSRAQALDGYTKSLVSVLPPLTIDQQAAITAGTVTMQEILRADVTGDGAIDTDDAQAIQNHMLLGTAFAAGSTFKRVVLTVESIINPMTTAVNILAADSIFNNVPFVSVPYEIHFISLWKQENIEITDLRRFVPETFTALVSEDITAEPPSGGKNIAFMPGDVLIGGDMLNVDGSPYSIDFEVGSIRIDLPEGSTRGEVDIFSNFIKDKMFFSDGEVVGSSALANNQVRASVSVQSFAKDLPPTDGYDFNDGYFTVDETVAILYTQDSGILRISANNIKNIVTHPELTTKIIITVYLKKAGFKNSEQIVSGSEIIPPLLVPIS